MDSPDLVVTEVLDTTIYDELTQVKLFGRNFMIGAQDKLFWISLKKYVIVWFVGSAAQRDPGFVVVECVKQ